LDTKAYWNAFVAGTYALAVVIFVLAAIIVVRDESKLVDDVANSGHAQNTN
jgi:hypothetical protein